MARQRGPAAVLDLLEPAWAGHLRGGAVAASLDLGDELVPAVARSLGMAARIRTVAELATTRPACLVVALSAVAAAAGGDGDFWPAWHRASRTRPSQAARQAWGEGFLEALRLLGRPLSVSPEQAVLVHAGTGSVAPSSRTGGTSEPQAVPSLRLEPYGAGVLMAAGTETGSGSGRIWRAVTPDKVAPDGRLLLFDEDGMPLLGALPGAPVWALRPAEWELRGDVPVRTVVESTLPLPWRGWRLTQVALDGVSRLGAGTESRRVAGRCRPRLLTGPALPGLTTAEGRAVRSSLPRLRLSAGEGDWQVEVRRGVGGPLLARARGDAGDWDDQRLWHRLPRPFVGELLVTAVSLGTTGARGLRRGVFVAEGLRVDYRPALRLPADDGGLEPAEALLTAAAGVTAAPTAVLFGAECISGEVRLVAGAAVHGLRVVPPRLRVRVEPEPGSGSASPPWYGEGMLTLSRHGLRLGGALRLELPGTQAAPPLAVIGGGGRVVQRLEPSALGRYPLRRLLDTVAEFGGVALSVTVDGRTATVAHVSAQPSEVDRWLPDQRSPVGPGALR